MNASCTWSGHAFPWSSDLLELERARQFGHPGSPFTQSADGTDDELLEAYADAEATLEKGPYLPYREILADGLRAIAARLGTTVTDGQAAAFGGSVADWPAFPDSAAALARLKTRFRLGVLTNCDDDLLAASNRRLGVAFDWIVTAQQVRSYKPDERNFAALFERLAPDGVRPERILHVAQSLFHDHAPAKRLGLTTVWIDRRHGRPGSGATPASEARPDATFASMADFASTAVPLPRPMKARGRSLRI